MDLVDTNIINGELDALNVEEGFPWTKKEKSKMLSVP